MKKQYLIFVMILGTMSLYAQNYLDAPITTFQDWETYYFCNDYDELHIHGTPGCNTSYWIYDNQVWFQEMMVITRENQGQWTYNGCGFSVHDFNIFFNSGISPTEPWPESTMLKCQGTIRLYAQANPQEDYTYLWTNGATTPYIDVSDLGTYGVTVTDACGNVVSDQITISNEYPIHEPQLPDTTFLCEGSSVILDAGPGFSEYNWSNGAHTQTISVTQPGTYSVQTVNEYGCDGSASTKVMYYLPPMIDKSIPLITIDTVNRTNHLMVVWNPTDPYTQQVAIYREGLTNQWQQVGVADYQTGRFIDTETDGSQRSYRYKLAAIDVCGDEAEKGRSYQSINTAYLGPGVEYWWIQWTPYKVADVEDCIDHYELYSVDNLQDFNITLVNEVINYEPSLNFFYVNMPHGIQDSIFFVKAYVKSQYGGGSVMSNFVQNYELLDIEERNEPSLFVYPNPSDGEFTVKGTSTVTIINLLGQIVAKSHNESKSHTFSLAPGIYFIRSDEGIVQKLIIQ